MSEALDRILQGAGPAVTTQAPTEDYSFTEAYLKALLMTVSDSDTVVSSAEELAAGLYGKSFAMADVMGQHSFLFPADVMVTIARELILLGETTWRIGKELTWQQAYPATTDPTPPNMLRVTYATDRMTGFGASPLDNATNLRAATRRAERAFAQTMDARIGSMVVTPAGMASEEMKEKIEKLEGALILTERGYASADQRSSSGSYQQVQLGPNPYPTLVGGSKDLIASTLATMGVPSTFAHGRVTREDYRIFLHTSLEPLGRLLISAAKKAGLQIELDWSRLFASDTMSKARAYGSLKSAGMDEADARRYAGYDK